MLLDYETHHTKMRAHESQSSWTRTSVVLALDITWAIILMFDF